MVHRPERLVDIMWILRQYKIEAKEIRFVSANTEKNPNLILVKAVKGGNKFLKIDKPLYIYEKNGDYSEEIKNMYNERQ